MRRLEQGMDTRGAMWFWVPLMSPNVFGCRSDAAFFPSLSRGLARPLIKASAVCIRAYVCLCGCGVPRWLADASAECCAMNAAVANSKKNHTLRQQQQKRTH